MTAVSPALAERSRKNETAVLHAFARVSQSRIAEQMGVNDSTVSRLKDGPIAQVCLLLAAAGLKVVPETMQCFPEDKVQALLTLARAHLIQMEHPEQLTWE